MKKKNFEKENKKRGFIIYCSLFIEAMSSSHVYEGALTLIDVPIKMGEKTAWDDTCLIS